MLICSKCKKQVVQLTQTPFRKPLCFDCEKRVLKQIKIALFRSELNDKE